MLSGDDEQLTHGRSLKKEGFKKQHKFFDGIYHDGGGAIDTISLTNKWYVFVGNFSQNDKMTKCFHESLHF